MKKYSKPGREEVIRSVLYIAIYVAAISLGAFLLLPKYWYLWGLLVLVGMVLLVGWHRGATVYQCPHCGHVYEISFLTDLFAPHGVGKDGPWLLLRCPDCKKRSKTRVLKRED
jgi:hypothetical protein